MKRDIEGLYIYQPKPIEKEPLLFGIGGLPGTRIDGLTIEEADKLIFVMSETRGIQINENTLGRIKLRQK